MIAGAHLLSRRGAEGERRQDALLARRERDDRRGSKAEPLKRLTIDGVGHFVHSTEPVCRVRLELRHDERNRGDRQRFRRREIALPDPVVRRDDDPFSETLPPEDREVELQSIADLTQAVDDRLIDGVRIDASEPRGDVADETLETEALVRGRRQTRLEIEPFGDVDNGCDQATRVAIDDDL